MNNINRSDSIDLLAQALANAQGMMEIPIVSGKSNDTLTSLVRATRPALAQNGLAVIWSCKDEIHYTENSELNLKVVTTVLIHSSGQWISSTVNSAYSPSGVTTAERDDARFTGYLLITGSVIG